ncbi:hypothetical protein [Vandammella animalimorsus]|uniref:hypothetical protein n=1 Tax=Vandammella animalimorsus TaxID=2029117 RepID=UPI00117830EA|nr:hypothetical protein [Vandammella animalimorsus]
MQLYSFLFIDFMTFIDLKTMMKIAKRQTKISQDERRLHSKNITYHLLVGRHRAKDVRKNRLNTRVQQIQKNYHRHRN